MAGHHKLLLSSMSTLLLSLLSFSTPPMITTVCVFPFILDASNVIFHFLRALDSAPEGTYPQSSQLDPQNWIESFWCLHFLSIDLYVLSLHSRRLFKSSAPQQPLGPVFELFNGQVAPQSFHALLLLSSARSISLFLDRASKRCLKDEIMQHTA